MRPGLGKWVRWSLVGLVAIVLLIQLVPAERTNPPVRTRVDAPQEVTAVLERACYDCHSHETRWPWYSRVAPVSWWVASHVEEGREDLDFSDWPAFDFEAQRLALKDVCEQIRKGEMPLWSYTLAHAEARLTAADRSLLLDWACEKP